MKVLDYHPPPICMSVKGIRTKIFIIILKNFIFYLPIKEINQPFGMPRCGFCCCTGGLAEQ